MKTARVNLADAEQRRRAAETLRLAADALEESRGEEFEIRVEPHTVEAFVSRFVAVKKTGAQRVMVRVTFVVGEGNSPSPLLSLGSE